MSNGARADGVLKIVLAVALAAASFVIVPLDATANADSRYRLVYMLGPLLGMIGLFEMLLGVSTTRWAEGWSQLPGWLKLVAAMVSATTLPMLVGASIFIAR